MPVIKLPTRIMINSRKSSIVNAFYNGILPRVAPSETEMNERLKQLKMEDEVKCVYCGEKHHTWDHLNPLIKNGEPTGYYTEINNLVPCCNSCNSSKGKKTWKEFLDYLDSNRNSERRSISEEQYRSSLETLSNYTKKYKAKRIDFHDPKIVDLLSNYKNKLHEILAKMEESKELEKELQGYLKEKYENE